jgi:DNA polymerase-3 subunit beta
MKLLIDKSALLPALTHAASVSGKSSMAILNHVLIDAKKNGDVHLRASNLDIEITAKCQAKVITPGSTTVSAQMLLDIVKNSAQGSEISMDLGDRLAIKSGRSHFNLPVLPIEDFPSFTDASWTSQFDMSAVDLRTMLECVAFASSMEATKFMLAGVHVHANGDRITAVGTNGHILATYDADMIADAELLCLTIPNDAAQKIIGILTGVEGIVRVLASGSKIGIDLPTANLRAKILDGTYPDYQRVVPVDLPHKILFTTDDLRAAVRRVANVSNEKVRGINMMIRADGITVTAKGDGADATDECEAEYAGPEAKFSFTVAYVLQALDAAGENDCTMEFTKEKEPTIWRGVGNDASMTVLMPRAG